MILNCEMCGTRYLVDSSDIGALGRHVRCAECGHEWFATTDGTQPTPKAVAADLPKAEPAPTPEEAKAVEEQAAAKAEDAGMIRNLPAVVPQPDYKSPAIVLGMGGALLAGLLAGLLLAKDDLIRAVPAAAHAYSVVGLMPPVPEAVPETVPETADEKPLLVLHDLEISLTGDGAVLAGRIENIGAVMSQGAALTVMEYDEAGTFLALTIMQLNGQVQNLAAGAEANFTIPYTLQEAATTKLKVEIEAAAEQPKAPAEDQ